MHKVTAYKHTPTDDESGIWYQFHEVGHVEMTTKKGALKLIVGKGDFKKALKKRGVDKFLIQALLSGDEVAVGKGYGVTFSRHNNCSTWLNLPTRVEDEPGDWARTHHPYLSWASTGSWPKLGEYNGKVPTQAEFEADMEEVQGRMIVTQKHGAAVVFLDDNTILYLSDGYSEAIWEDDSNQWDESQMQVWAKARERAIEMDNPAHQSTSAKASARQ